MSDEYKVRVFAPLAHEGSASAAMAAAIKIADMLGVDVQIHPLSMCPEAGANGGRVAGITLAAGTFAVSRDVVDLSKTP